MEHRYSLRRPYGGDVRIEWFRGSLPMRACDLSGSGMGLTGNALALPLHAPVSVRFVLDEAEQIAVHVRGMIVRRTARGAGILFIESLEETLEAAAPAGRDAPQPVSRPAGGMSAAPRAAVA